MALFIGLLTSLGLCMGLGTDTRTPARLQRHTVPVCKNNIPANPQQTHSGQSYYLRLLLPEQGTRGASHLLPLRQRATERNYCTDW